MAQPINLKNCVLLADLSVLMVEHTESDYPMTHLLPGTFLHLSHLELLRRFAVKHGYSTPNTAGWHAMQIYQTYITDARSEVGVIEGMLKERFVVQAGELSEQPDGGKPNPENGPCTDAGTPIQT
ncbi:hypothetical protein [Pararobbsia alpina]|uniref:Uncharacterized protein n=1 Tax=Pararobbsia alpina TaxID=621374 RepID=A0A6S7BKV0_9BURK|nr:hypothetical protein [Pararobbsia alpina]CAB3804015.1 hypothetical protein LMG28138_05443 [Pararobbsia alpina]